MNTANTQQLPIDRQIGEIIEKRRSLAMRIRPVTEHLDKLEQAIAALYQQTQALTGVLSSPELIETQQKIHQLKEALVVQSDRLKLLGDRFSRSTLDIGVVGKTRQGKSEFLKTLSGLPEDIIPSRPGDPCTAVRSKIYHHDEPEAKPFVTFHSEETFLEEVIAEYWNQLKLEEQGFACPKTLDELETAQLPEQLPGNTTYQTMYDHLYKDYFLGLRDYRSELKPGLPQRVAIDPAEIKAYVTQERNGNGYLKSVKHLAVREVEIYHKFNQLGVKRLGLVDIPGLGDTRLGDEKLMLETLRREVDAVLFIHRPDAVGYLWKEDDLTLYDGAATVFDDLAERSFMVLNHMRTNGNNLEACKFLRSNTKHMRFVGECEIADCIDSTEANRVLARVLDYLNHQILALEERYARSCQTDLLKLHHTLNLELKKLRRSLSETDAYDKFVRLFKQFEKELSTGLGQLKETLKQRINQDDADFKAVVDQALAACESYSEFPTPEQIRQRSYRSEAKDALRIAYELYVVEMRVQLSKNFLELDDGLRQAANQLKESISELLLNKAHLRNLANHLRSTAEAADGSFLELLTEKLEERQNPLALGFRTLSNFNISYGAQLLNLIRRNLELLDVDALAEVEETQFAAAQVTKTVAETTVAVGSTLASIDPTVSTKVMDAVDAVADAAITASFKLTAETARERLQALHKQAVDRCRETLNRWLKVPHSIRYYMAEEFTDLVLYDQGIIDNGWSIFLQEFKSQVWSELAELENHQQAQQAWQTAIQDLLHLNQAGLIRFLD